MKIIQPNNTPPDYRTKYLEAVKTIKTAMNILYFNNDIISVRYLLYDF